MILMKICGSGFRLDLVGRSCRMPSNLGRPFVELSGSSPKSALDPNEWARLARGVSGHDAQGQAGMPRYLLFLDESGDFTDPPPGETSTHASQGPQPASQLA